MSIREDRDAKNATYVEALNRGDAAACADLFAEDAAFLLRGSHPVRGRPAIQALHQRFIEAGVKMLSLDTLDIEAHGDLAYAILAYATEEESGRALLVMKRQSDGSWKVQVESVTAS
jgi:uncharacterized protein (TIGR02246 family)